MKIRKRRVISRMLTTYDNGKLVSEALYKNTGEYEIEYDGLTNLKQFEDRHPILECQCGANLLSPFIKQDATKFKCFLKMVSREEAQRYAFAAYGSDDDDEDYDDYDDDDYDEGGICSMCKAGHSLKSIYLDYLSRQFLSRTKNPLQFPEMEALLSGLDTNKVEDIVKKLDADELKAVQVSRLQSVSPDFYPASFCWRWLAQTKHSGAIERFIKDHTIFIKRP